MKLKEHSTNLRSKDTETAEADVLWLPSFHFVVTIVEYPNNMTDAERASLMELAVESHSPFPIEQIFGGTIQSSHLKQLCSTWGSKSNLPSTNTRSKAPNMYSPLF